ncbi:MAG: BREX-1 system adenine-specific DNA-methyltransferase PglX [Coprobacillus sp.]|nr:BREX-1 system adenine-specific DNA-methyltransferase PglX [Coprobacillus sp.]MCI6329734.1 BREX-1 system adenine-specific DNA-methyltransferase PglX [Erysipelotrichaceae bacterium]
MDKKALFSYATWAKTNLEEQIEVSLKTLGINSENDIKAARIVGDYTIIDGDPNSYPVDYKNKRDNIIAIIKNEGYKQVIEEFAYTWFNRIVALRFMEVHDFLPHGFRVLSSRDGGFEPEILRNVAFIKDDLKLDIDLVNSLKAQGKIDEAFRYVLFRQCSALSDVLPMLFDADLDYLELLLPKALLKGETFITKLMDIGEEDFLNDVEVIGWLYQFYISQKKDAVFASKATITKDTLPAVTQLFTPDWIVRYMTENSVGRIWLESYPDSPIKADMKYYVEDVKQETDIQIKIDAIKYKNVNPEDIRIIEPCCGSGHILVYVFDLLYKMYEERGYQSREIPTLILKNNLVGLDVDKRAAQLASFSLIMKARNRNFRFFANSYYVKPKIYEIIDARELLNNNYEQQLLDLKILSNEEIKEIKWLVETFRYAKTIGSLLKIKKEDFTTIENAIKMIESKAVINIFNSKFLSDGVKCLKYLLSQAKVMAEKYDVMITNPPYIGISSMEKPVKDYASFVYPNSKTDMFAMFMETNFVKQNGFLAMINMHSWMFLSSYEKLRKSIIQTKYICNMIHLGAHAFESIGGEVVQTTSFVIRNSAIASNGVYYRLVDEKDKEAAFLVGGGYNS